MHASRKALLELAHELAEVDTFLGREVAGETTTVPLPLGVGDLHVEVHLPHEFERSLSDGALVDAEADRGVDLLLGRESDRRRELGR